MTRREFPKSWLALLSSLALVAFLGSGCGPSVEDACADYCEKFGECDPSATPDDVAQCRSDCEGDIKPADETCHEALFDLSDCVQDNTCPDIANNACQTEIAALVASCPVQ